MLLFNRLRTVFIIISDMIKADFVRSLLSLSKKPLISYLIRGKIIYSSKNGLKNHKTQVNQKLLPPMYRILFKIHGSKFKPDPVCYLR